MINQFIGFHLTINHPNSYEYNCVTLPTEFKKINNIYYDDFNRIYRPRVQLTIKKALGGNFHPGQSESYIYFDCYLLPQKKNQIDADTIQQKPYPPQSGDIITFKRPKLLKSDTDTIPEFKAIIEDVYWGRFVRLNKTKSNENLGLILVHVYDSYDRSLITAPHSEYIKYNSNISDEYSSSFIQFDGTDDDLDSSTGGGVNGGGGVGGIPL